MRGGRQIIETTRSLTVRNPNNRISYPKGTASGDTQMALMMLVVVSLTLGGA